MNVNLLSREVLDWIQILQNFYQCTLTQSNGESDPKKNIKCKLYHCIEPLFVTMHLLFSFTKSKL